MMKDHLLKHHVVDVETGNSVAAFMIEFTADMWAIEYSEKTKRELEVRTA